MLGSVFLLAFLYAADAQAPTGLAVEQQALVQRRAISTAVVKCEAQGKLAGDHGERNIVRTDTIFFAGDKRRADIARTDSAMGKPYRQLRCFAAGRHISWFDRRESGGGFTALSDTDVKYLGDPLGAAVVDPRMIGMSPDDFANLVHYNLEFVFGSGDRKDAQGLATRVTHQGIDCLQSDYERNSGSKVRCLVAPEMDYAPVRVESEFVVNNMRYQDSVSIKNERHRPSNIWFPVECWYQRLEDGKVTREEQLKVTVVSLNEPIPPETFTLAGMGIPPGVHVSRVPEDEHLVGVNVWNGREVVHEEGDDETVPGAVPPPGSARPVILTFFSIVLAVIAAAALWRYLSSRTASS